MRRGVELEPHVLALAPRGGDGPPDQRRLQPFGGDPVDDLGVVCGDAPHDPLPDAMLLERPPRHLYFRKLRHLSPLPIGVFPFASLSFRTDGVALYMRYYLDLEFVAQ